VDDEIELGPLALTEEARFTLCCGAAEDLPSFGFVSNVEPASTDGS
jgi:hypothetical protein